MVKLFSLIFLFSSLVNAAYFDTVKQGTTPWTVSGTISLNDINGIATAVNQVSANGYLASIDGKLTSPVQVSGAFLTNNELRSQPVQISQTSNIVGVSNFPATTSVPNLPTDGSRDSTLLSGNVKVQIVSGANVASVYSNGALVVAGNSAIGAAPANPPLSVAGVDGSGLKRHFLTESDGALRVVEPLLYGRFNGAVTTTLKSGAGYFNTVCYTTPSNGSTLTAYDNTTAAGTIIAVYTPPNGSFLVCLPLGSVAFTTGLTIVTTGTGQWTVSYR